MKRTSLIIGCLLAGAVLSGAQDRIKITNGNVILPYSIMNDATVLVEDGKIVDVGTFDELFENNIKFKNMFYAENLEN